MDQKKREELSKKVESLHSKYGVTWSFLGKRLNVTGHAVMRFGRGDLYAIGEEKCQMLLEVTDRYFSLETLWKGH